MSPSETPDTISIPTSQVQPRHVEVVELLLLVLVLLLVVLLLVEEEDSAGNQRVNT